MKKNKAAIPDLPKGKAALENFKKLDRASKG
jgi:hypothetical protein